MGYNVVDCGEKWGEVGIRTYVLVPRWGKVTHQTPKAH